MSLSEQVVSLQQQINKHTDDNKMKMTAEKWQQKRYDDAPALMKETPTVQGKREWKATMSTCGFHTTNYGNIINLLNAELILLIEIVLQCIDLDQCDHTDKMSTITDETVFKVINLEMTTQMIIADCNNTRKQNSKSLESLLLSGNAPQDHQRCVVTQQPSGLHYTFITRSNGIKQGRTVLIS
jgi:hypothetical protein